MRNIKLIHIAILAMGTLLSSCDKQIDFKSKGTEIFPPHNLFTVALFRMNNLNIAPAFFKDKWTTVQLGSSPCEKECLDNLKKLNAVTEGQKLFVFDNLASTQHLKTLTNLFKSTSITMGVTVHSTDFFFAHFEIVGIKPEDRDKYFYLVNPDGAVAYSLAIDSVGSDDIDLEIKALMN